MLAEYERPRTGIWDIRVVGREFRLFRNAFKGQKLDIIRKLYFSLGDVGLIHQCWQSLEGKADGHDELLFKRV
jgi:hypothetical protein